MARYSAVGPPEFIAHTANFPSGVVERYLELYHLFDPYAVYWREPSNHCPLQFQTFESALTPRERQIVELILKGYPTTLIAEKLSLSRGTVKTHRRRIYDKLDITTERELFLMYIDAALGGVPG